jgi:hypothetical protein
VQEPPLPLKVQLTGTPDVSLHVAVAEHALKKLGFRAAETASSCG